MDEIAHKEVQKMFEIADMKSSNKECSWASTQAYKLGLEVNEQNDHLIRLRKSEGNDINECYLFYLLFLKRIRIIDEHNTITNQ